GLAHRLVFTFAGDDDAVTFTVSGTDADDHPITEDIAGKDSGTTESAKYFKTVTSLTADAETDGVVDIGWVDEVVTQTYPLNFRSPYPAGLFYLDITGTISVDVDFFMADPGAFSEQADIPSRVDADLDGETSTVAAHIEEFGY